jgi:aprataxin
MPSPSSSIPQLQILRAYAKLDDASLVATLPPTVYFSHTRHTLTIFDAYPKALFHFLVLPRLRIPTSSSSGRTPAAEDRNHGDGDSEVKVVADCTADLTSLRTLLRRPLQRAAAATSDTTNTDTVTDIDIDPDARARAKGTLSVLSDEATRLQNQIEREMQAHYGFKWPIWIGFHAVPSME